MMTVLQEHDTCAKQCVGHSLTNEKLKVLFL